MQTKDCFDMLSRQGLTIALLSSTTGIVGFKKEGLRAFEV